MEIECLRSELRQSSDREADIQAKGFKAVKELQEKLDAEIVAHVLTTRELNKQKEELARKEGIITSMREAVWNKKAWYDEQIENQQQVI